MDTVVEDINKIYARYKAEIARKKRRSPDDIAMLERGYRRSMKCALTGRTEPTEEEIIECKARLEATNRIRDEVSSHMVNDLLQLIFCIYLVLFAVFIVSKM